MEEGGAREDKGERREGEEGGGEECGARVQEVRKMRGTGGMGNQRGEGLGVWFKQIYILTLLFKRLAF